MHDDDLCYPVGPALVELASLPFPRPVERHHQDQTGKIPDDGYGYGTTGKIKPKLVENNKQAGYVLPSVYLFLLLASFQLGMAISVLL